MNQYLRTRLKEGRLNKNLKQSDVTKLTGIKNTTLSNYENGNTEPDMNTFLKLCDLYELDYAELLSEAYGYKIPGFNFDIKKSDINLLERYHSLDSHGKKMVDFTLDEESKRIEAEKAAPPLVEVRGRLIQYYQRLASAGSGQFVFDDIPVDLVEIPNIPKYRKVKYAIGVNGNSMEPMFHDREMLLVEPTNAIYIDEIGIFIRDNESFVKKLGERELISVNEDVPNIPLTSDTRCVGRVVDSVSKENCMDIEKEVQASLFETVGHLPSRHNKKEESESAG